MATEAAWLHKEQTHGKKKEKLCLDINRPSHGRPYLVRVGDYLRFAGNTGVGPFSLLLGL